MLAPPQPGQNLIVVGIGASAGGLDALLALCSSLQANGRLTYVVAQHMASQAHSELLLRLLQREAVLPVVLARDGMRLQPDTLHLIPAGCDGWVQAAVLRIGEPDPAHFSTPSVNRLFRSMAESCGRHAIAVVLSGTGSDGTEGCRTIRAAGGQTLAQNPVDAKFEGMPGSAIDAGLIDRVLTAPQIGQRLAHMFPELHGEARQAWALAEARRRKLEPPTRPLAAAGQMRNTELQQLVAQIYRLTGVDFSGYKEDTLLRRLAKRKSELGLASTQAYRSLVQQKPEELRLLQRAFLVSVSSFFRDSPAFRALEQALRQALVRKPAGQAMRIWVPGCASGEETYTLAMLLQPLLDQEDRRHPLEIVGTDLNPVAIDLARAGLYRASAIREMPPERVARYFLSERNHVRVKPEFQANVRFELGDVLTRQPPGQFDLVSCRNLLIYMKRELQDQLIRTLHQSLLPRGLLFIGLSESLGDAGDQLFSPLDYFHRLFMRKS